MIRVLSLIVGVLTFTVSLSSQDRAMLVVHPFTIAPGVELPYDMDVMQKQLVAEFKVLLGKDFEVVGETPDAAQDARRVYTLNGVVTAWRPGNAAKRLIVGLGSGREASDIQIRITEAAGEVVLQGKDTVRTNFYSQHAGSTGTLAHPIALKVADRIKIARLSGRK